MKDMTYEERLKKLKLPSLTYRRLRGDMIEVYKLLHGKYDPEAASLLKLRKDYAPKYALRGHDLTLLQQRARLNLRKYSFTFRVVSTWNSLPAAVVQAPSINAFKNRLDKYWRNEDFVYNYKAPYTGGQRLNVNYEEDEELTIEAMPAVRNIREVT